MRITDDEFKALVESSRSIRQVLTKMGLKAAGGNYKTIKSRIKKLNLDTSHLLGQGWNLNGNQNWNTQPLIKILIKKSTYTNTNRLRLRIIREGLCEERCKRTKWRGNKISLELEHKNGNKFDHRISNIELLCPNCHALTPTILKEY